MELDGKLLEVGDRENLELESLEGKETKIGNLSGRSDLDYCPRCSELEEKCKKAEEKCGVLALEVERKKRELELLESKIATVVRDKPAIQEDVACFFGKGEKEPEKKITDVENVNMDNGEEMKGPENVIDLTEEGDKVFELMVENNALNAEIGVWEAKCKAMELRVTELEKRLCSKGGENALAGTEKLGPVSSRGGKEINEVNELQEEFQGATTPVVETLSSNIADVDATERDILHEKDMGYGSRARKQLVFEEGTPARKMSPVTPAGAKHHPVCPIDITDSDDEAYTTKLPVNDIQAKKETGSVNVVSLGGKELPFENNSTWSPNQSDEDDVPYCNRRVSSTLTAKRKRAFNMVTSDGGSDTDDNTPICRLVGHSSSTAASENENGKPVRRRRLVRLRKQQKESASEKRSGSNLRNVETRSLRGTDNETEVEESDAEDESLDGFIVSSSDSEGCDASKGSDVSTNEKSESDDASDNNMDYGDIISRIGRRRKDRSKKWAFEAEMLADFGKDPELCMKAVCTLYRKQTSEEKSSKATIFVNQRGFSQCDAVRGSILGEFLTDGDPLGDLTKTVEELQEYDPKGVELCRTLATHYSKQLFAMYENKEDPLWPALGPK